MNNKCKHWSQEDLQYLKENYGSIDNKKLSNYFGRSSASVRNKAYELRITSLDNIWSEAEIKYLKENYKSYNLKEIAGKLNKLKSNVCRKAKILGIERTKKKKEKLKYGDRSTKPPKYKNKEERSNATSERLKKHFKKNGHPRGMLGKTHSKEYKKQVGKRLKEQWDDPNSIFNSESHRQNLSDRMHNMQVNKKLKNRYTNAKGGKRKDLNDKYFRSSWEANFARVLNYLKKKDYILDWEYEVDTFIFENIKRGTRSYTPDFKIKPQNGKSFYYEVKGWMDAKSKTKLKRMSKYYAEEKIILIDSKVYKKLCKKYSKSISNWE